MQTTVSLTNAVRQITAGSNEGSPKWLTIARNQDVLNYGAQQASVNNPDLFNTDCSVMPVIAYLVGPPGRDARPRGRRPAPPSPTRTATAIASSCSPPAAPASRPPPTSWCARPGRRCCCWSTLAVIVLCFITFRSWRAVVVAVVPLVVTSVLCEALMVCAGHRRQGRDAAGDRARRRHRRRLRAVPAERAARAAARGRDAGRGLPHARCSSPARWWCWSA